MSVSYEIVQVSDLPELRGYLDFNGYLNQEILGNTIIARDAEKIIGCVMVRAMEDNTVVGPLVADKRWVTIRLIDAVENYLYELGGVGYVFHVGEEDEEWAFLVHKAATKGLFTAFAFVEDGTWYIRRFVKEVSTLEH